jgi:hypothetical protein
VWEVGGWRGWMGSKVYALCEMVLEDLNNYAECMIPIGMSKFTGGGGAEKGINNMLMWWTDDSNTINLKLFPTRPPPPPILAHQVPLLTISLSSLQPPISSDLTLNRILPYVNGVHSISRIAQLADTDLSLTRRAIQHLVYYGCLVLLDIFSFSAIYAPTAEIGVFVIDDAIKDECIRYIRVPRLRIGSEAKTIRLGSESETSHNQDTLSTSSIPRTESSSSLANPTSLNTTPFDHPAPPSHTTTANDDTDENEWPISHPTLIHLYTSLRQGLSLKAWVLSNLSLLTGIDVRRFITFGIIKGFLYRVHKYAIATTSSLPPAPPTSLATSTANLNDEGIVRANEHVGGVIGFALHRPSTVAQAQPQYANQQDGMGGQEGQEQTENALSLLKFLDGMHCFDEMCTELGVSEKVVDGRIRGLGEGLGVVVQR